MERTNVAQGTTACGGECLRSGAWRNLIGHEVALVDRSVGVLQAWPVRFSVVISPNDLISRLDLLLGRSQRIRIKNYSWRLCWVQVDVDYPAKWHARSSQQGFLPSDKSFQNIPAVKANYYWAHVLHVANAPKFKAKVAPLQLLTGSVVTLPDASPKMEIPATVAQANKTKPWFSCRVGSHRRSVFHIVTEQQASR